MFDQAARLVVKERMEAGEATTFSQNLRARLIAQKGPQQRRPRQVETCLERAAKPHQ